MPYSPSAVGGSLLTRVVLSSSQNSGPSASFGVVPHVPWYGSLLKTPPMEISGHATMSPSLPRSRRPRPKVSPMVSLCGLPLPAGFCGSPILIDPCSSSFPHCPASDDVVAELLRSLEIDVPGAFPATRPHAASFDPIARGERANWDSPAAAMTGPNQGYPVADDACQSHPLDEKAQGCVGGHFEPKSDLRSRVIA